MAVIRKISRTKGIFGNSARWVAAYDCGEHLYKYRHVRMFIADVTVLLQNGSPFTADIKFADSLSDIFAKEGGQSLRVPGHICRDETMFQVGAFKVRLGTGSMTITICIPIHL